MKRLLSPLVAALLQIAPAEAVVTASYSEIRPTPTSAAFDPVATAGTLDHDIVDARAGLMLDRRSAQMSKPQLAADEPDKTRFADEVGTVATGEDLPGLEVVAASGAGALLVAVLGHRLVRRRHGRLARPVAVDRRVEATAFEPLPTPARLARFDLPPTTVAGPDVLRHFHPDAPPITPSPSERSRPDYIRIDDVVEMWTPSKVDAARDAAAPAARRRRSDARGSDYRFHRLNADGSVRSAERKTFMTDIDAHRFAETIGQGDVIEVWLDARRLATIPANFCA